MTDPDPLRYARRLSEAASDEYARALGHLDDGDPLAFSEALRRVMALLGSARWAAEVPEEGPELLAQYGLDLPAREAPTTRVRRPASSAPPAAE